MEIPRGFEGLLTIMDRLRGPDGCPWDREQDHSTLRRYLLEECYEVVEALDRGDPAALAEELGDLLFQIVFLSRIGKERGEFTMEDVIRGITDKMVRRHEHVFGSATATTSDDVVRRWEETKRREKPAAPRSTLGQVPATLPAMLEAQRLGLAAARVGFDWRRSEEVLAKVEEELRELRLAASGAGGSEVEDELGDLLFSVAMLARWLKVDPEAALARSNRKFRTRFERMEQAAARAGFRIEETDPETLERLWNAAKLQDPLQEPPAGGR